ncbi:hypothetical protein CERSUDRAFT_93982 [Gelatoporia subvermispora B]|uniref:Uncharacterized protein n=1 Tax=Ceriporiopsis subvermispora (strain B) TaxID=914234 RepID=M2QN62_CERS8|nr:hypothetical protein CERSUDRAFT_93982 [Gelatoporia subvermispora B]
MALETFDTLLLSTVEEFLLCVCTNYFKNDVYPAASTFLNLVPEDAHGLTFLEHIVYLQSLMLVRLFVVLETAMFLHPVEDKAGNVDGQDRRGIVEAAGVGQRLNKMVDGVEFLHEESLLALFPFHLLKTDLLITDYFSTFMCHLILCLADHAIVYAGMQKNIGPIRQDWMLCIRRCRAVGT